MNDFSKWKYILVAVVLVLGFVYALPIIYTPQAAVQISASHGATVDQALKEKVLGILQTKKITFDDVELNGDRILARFPNTDAQFAGSDALKTELGDNNYTVALNLASTVPGWLRAIGANRMPLGLDLQGGVHFLMEVDSKVALQKMQQRYADDIRTALRNAKIRYESVNPSAQGVTITLRSEDDRKQAGNAIAKDVNQPEKLGDQPPMELSDAPESNGTFPIVARFRDATVQATAKQIVASNLTTLRNRVNQLGVTEPLIQQQGTNRILVELPGVQDTAEAKKVLGAFATLEYHPTDEVTNPYEAERTGNVPPDSRLYHMNTNGPDGKPIPVVLKKKIIAAGDELVDASAGPAPEDGRPSVSVHLNSAGGKKMLDFTSQNVGKRMAVVFIERTTETKTVDGKEVRVPKVTEQVISNASINGVFSNRFNTTGLSSMKEATELALLLRAGSLAAPADIVEERVIGPSLGQDNIQKGFRAVMIGLLAVLIAAALYYHVFGLIADIALILNLVLLIAVLSIFQATLTMPGIAGIVLTLGMAIDANVLICERIREELRNGSTPLASIRAGYEKAWATILDANVTHLLAAFGLFAFGSGPIKGFAVTLAIGILTSMFTSVTVTHALVNLVYSGRKLKGLAVGGGYASGAH